MLLIVNDLNVLNLMFFFFRIHSIFFFLLLLLSNIISFIIISRDCIGDSAVDVVGDAAKVEAVMAVPVRMILVYLKIKLNSNQIDNVCKWIFSSFAFIKST